MLGVYQLNVQVQVWQFPCNKYSRDPNFVRYRYFLNNLPRYGFPLHNTRTKFLLPSSHQILSIMRHPFCSASWSLSPWEPANRILPKVRRWGRQRKREHESGWGMGDRAIQVLDHCHVLLANWRVGEDPWDNWGAHHCIGPKPTMKINPTYRF